VARLKSSCRDQREVTVAGLGHTVTYIFTKIPACRQGRSAGTRSGHCHNAGERDWWPGQCLAVQGLRRNSSIGWNLGDNPPAPPSSISLASCCRLAVGGWEDQAAGLLLAAQLCADTGLLCGCVQSRHPLLRAVSVTSPVRDAHSSPRHKLTM
jgi:hypothetical protein